jgi:heat shock protein HspQ
MNSRLAKFAIGQVVKHRIFPFRGVVFDVDPVFANTEEWWNSIPEDIRPTKDQPFYHLLAENDDNTYVAYVSEQNLLADDTGRAGGSPADAVIFESFARRLQASPPDLALDARSLSGNGPSRVLGATEASPPDLARNSAERSGRNVVS